MPAGSRLRMPVKGGAYASTALALSPALHRFAFRCGRCLPRWLRCPARRTRPAWPLSRCAAGRGRVWVGAPPGQGLLLLLTPPIETRKAWLTSRRAARLASPVTHSGRGVRCRPSRMSMPLASALQAPGVEDEHGVEAAQFLWQLVGGNRRLTAYVERRERLAAAGKSWGTQVGVARVYASGRGCMPAAGRTESCSADPVRAHHCCLCPLCPLRLAPAAHPH